MLETSFGELVKRIKDELLLWLLGMLVLAVVAGIRDRVTFIAVLVVGAALIALRLFLERRQHGLPLSILFASSQADEVEIERCEYELRRTEGNTLKSGGELAFSLEVSGWVCFLPRNLDTTDIIRIYLTDRTGQRWETGPFRPLFGSREARKAQ